MKFCRIYGCYENLVGGQLADALQEVSGGVPATLDLARANLKDDPNEASRLFNRLKESFETNALIVAAIAVSIFLIFGALPKTYFFRGMKVGSNRSAIASFRRYVQNDFATKPFAFYRTLKTFPKDMPVAKFSNCTHN